MASPTEDNPASLSRKAQAQDTSEEKPPKAETAGSPSTPTGKVPASPYSQAPASPPSHASLCPPGHTYTCCSSQTGRCPSVPTPHLCTHCAPTYMALPRVHHEGSCYYWAIVSGPLPRAAGPQAGVTQPGRSPTSPWEALTHTHKAIPPPFLDLS